jgi:predicted secreted protein
MTWTAGIAIYMVTWWIVLFAVLPFGVVSQHEQGEAKGVGDPGAPVRPLLIRKALVTTVIAAIIWSGIAYVIVYKPIGFDQIPFMPKFQDWPGAETAPQH